MPEQKQKDWDPGLYLKFRNERTQPSIDLVSRINIQEPGTIIDIGCGPGNSTQVLKARWPGSRIAGLDSSPNMIEKAKQDHPEQEWLLGDSSNVDTDKKYTIVFSNATIQWIPEHEKLIPRLWQCVEKNGALAVQIPLFREMSLGKAIELTAQGPQWRSHMTGCAELFTYHEPGFYYDLLAKAASSIDLWVTDYIHVLDSQEAMIEWIRSTGLRPYLDRLNTPELRQGFEKELLSRIKKDYPLQKNGKVLFPFKRLFFVAYK
jgi:trans-aconitate 2-methyltransferase